MDFSKTKVASAAVNHCKLDLSSTHITTGSFMNLQPVYYRHMIPGEHIKGIGNVISRLAPVAVPTYGRCRINMRAFFVPFRTVFPNFNDFIADTVASNASSSSIVTGSPTIANDEFITYFTTATYFNQPVSISLDPNVPQDAAIINADRYDFCTNGTYYILSPRGRDLMKLLKSLGYRVIWDGSDKTLSFSALPLLCMAKVYLDWYANSAYLNNALYLNVARLLKFNDPASSLQLTQSNLSNILNLLGYICYDSGNDVYLNAWDSPVSPNTGLFSSHQVNDITLLTQSSASIDSQVSSYVDLSTNGTPRMQQSSSSNVNIGTDFIHQALKSLTDYMKRNQLSGAYAVDRFLARYGINLDSAKVDRSIYVGASSVDINFGDVMQTVNTAASGQPSNLGDYAGQGFGRGSLDFDFKCDEFGLFLVNYTIIPVAHLYQGFDRNLLHINKDSFYVPEFDNLGCSAIAKGEVYVSKNDTFATGPNYLGVFGFAPRYYEYKQKQDFVTGDFDSPYAMAGGDSWHLNRILDDSTFGSQSDLTHSFGFTQGRDASQYDRIFQYVNSDIDKFYLVFNFAVEGLSPCKSLFDTYKFEELGDKLVMDASGAKVN